MQAIGTYCMQNWRPSKQQVKLLKSLLRHYIIRPLTSYSNLIPIVETYIHDHAKRLHLELYKQDPTVKVFVHDLLTVENNAVRSAIRKVIFLSVKEKTDLETFSRKIVNGYTCLRSRASHQRTSWPAWLSCARSPAELDNLFEKNGNNRDGPKWREWEQDVINADNILAGPASGSETAAASAATAAPGSDDEDGDAQGLEERDVNIPALGDLAALSVGPVVRDPPLVSEGWSIGYQRSAYPMDGHQVAIGFRRSSNPSKSDDSRIAVYIRVENHLFKIHRYHLIRGDASVFKDMFLLPSGAHPSQGSIELDPIALADDSVEQFRAFLTIAYAEPLELQVAETQQDQLRTLIDSEALNAGETYGLESLSAFASLHYLRKVASEAPELTATGIVPPFHAHPWLKTSHRIRILSGAWSQERAWTHFAATVPAFPPDHPCPKRSHATSCVLSWEREWRRAVSSPTVLATPSADLALRTLKLEYELKPAFEASSCISAAFKIKELLGQLYASSSHFKNAVLVPHCALS
ncbi:hypothetical protein B0H13DRAFT_2317520 [Mycena leptocephala]|nr:hypothetical protein B0H13DRAFT_2324788 [Mycena leptocephala]KAJ7922476.1 hypothetical protein B0H13DRAFT_2317520 [Mycena leptocephala]